MTRARALRCVKITTSKIPSPRENKFLRGPGLRPVGILEVVMLCRAPASKSWFRPPGRLTVSHLQLSLALERP